MLNITNQRQQQYQQHRIKRSYFILCILFSTEKERLIKYLSLSAENSFSERFTFHQNHFQKKKK